MFPSFLYSCETWGELPPKIEKEILLIEKKAIKMILGVKSGTSDNIIFTEINRPDLISKIYQRQFNFYLRFQSMTDVSAAKKIWGKFQQVANYSEKPYLKHL